MKTGRYGAKNRSSDLKWLSTIPLQHPNALNSVHPPTLRHSVPNHIKIHSTLAIGLHKLKLLIKDLTELLNELPPWVTEVLWQLMQNLRTRKWWGISVFQTKSSLQVMRKIYDC